MTIRKTTAYTIFLKTCRDITSFPGSFFFKQTNQIQTLQIISNLEYILVHYKDFLKFCNLIHITKERHIQMSMLRTMYTKDLVKITDKIY